MRNIKLAFRNLRQNILYATINIAGLAVSITVILLILLWVQDELSYDKFYPRSSDIYLVTAKGNSNGVERYWTSTPTAVSYVGREEISGVESACAVDMYHNIGYLEYNGEHYFENTFIATDASFFSIFTTTFIEGSSQNPLPDPHSVILTESLAKKIFGDKPALGKQLKAAGAQGDEKELYYVSGVVSDQPRNSYLEYDAIFSFEKSPFANTWNNWSWRNFYLLRPDADVQKVTQQLLEIQKKNFPNVVLEKVSLQPLTDLRLHDASGKETGLASIRLFSLIALALFLTACINYINHTTARASKRNKEVAVKKIMGVKKRQLMLQLMSETFIMCFIAMAIAVVLVFLLVPGYNHLTEKQIEYSFTSPWLWGTCLWVFVVITLVSGIYPALKMSSFRLLDAFKKQVVVRKTGISLRKLLIVLQFVVVSVFIIITMALNRQMSFIQNKQLGYDREQVIQISVYSNSDIQNHYESFKADLEKSPCVQGVTASQGSILWAGFQEMVRWEGMPDKNGFNAYFWGVDRNFVSTMNIALVEGSGFTGTSADKSICILNETAVKKMNVEQPIGMRVSYVAGDTETTYMVAGVVKDFHFEPLSSAIGPLIMYLPSSFRTIYVKIRPGKIEEGITEIEQSWKKFSPIYPPSYNFLDDAFNSIYKSDRQKRDLFSYFSLIAILISCLGLFGLVTYTVEVRTKEIGIRKAIGASSYSIIKMLSKEFLVLVGIAVVVSIPIAYYSLGKLLHSYAYRISITWWMILAAILIVFVLVIFTVSAQALRAARANPVKAIKTE